MGLQRDTGTHGAHGTQGDGDIGGHEGYGNMRDMESTPDTVTQGDGQHGHMRAIVTKGHGGQSC